VNQETQGSSELRQIKMAENLGETDSRGRSSQAQQPLATAVPATRRSQGCDELGHDTSPTFSEKVNHWRFTSGRWLTLLVLRNWRHYPMPLNFQRQIQTAAIMKEPSSDMGIPLGVSLSRPWHCSGGPAQGRLAPGAEFWLQYSLIHQGLRKFFNTTDHYQNLGPSQPLNQPNRGCITPQSWLGSHGFFFSAVSPCGCLLNFSQLQPSAEVIEFVLNFR
jgi:hypothetical protein